MITVDIYSHPDFSICGRESNWYLSQKAPIAIGKPNYPSIDRLLLNKTALNVSNYSSEEINNIIKQRHQSDYWLTTPDNSIDMYVILNDLDSIVAKAAMRGQIDTAIAAKESVFFLKTIAKKYPPTTYSVGEGESILKWERKTGVAYAFFEGDGEYGYSFVLGDKHIPGNENGLFSTRTLPADLNEFLM